MRGLDIRACLGMATSFGSLRGDEGQAVPWAFTGKDPFWAFLHVGAEHLLCAQSCDLIVSMPPEARKLQGEGYVPLNSLPLEGMAL